MLVGRREEAARIDELIAAAREGQSGVLVIRGEAGIGKSALLEHAARCADGMVILRGVGVQAESELPHAALHQILRPVLATVERLPAAQAAALRAAFALSDEVTVEEPFRVALAVLGVLAEAAEERPLVCLADDAQWLDHASAEALLFTARRLVAEPVAMLFAARDDAEHPFPAPGLADLRLTGLARSDARTLVTRDVGARCASEVVDWILDRADGNPLVLKELPASLTPDQVEGRSSLAGAVPPTTSVEQLYLERLEPLPSATRELLLLAAAEETGDRAVIIRAANALGLSDADLDPAEMLDLVRVGLERIEFRHPLVRSAVYLGAAQGRRERAHRALAAALSEPSDADRRAWHRAAGASGTDEDAARDLEATAERASQRGGYLAASRALQRAASLSAGDYHRSRRLLDAAELAWLAGRVNGARELLSDASRVVPPHARARVTALQGRIEVRRGVFAEAMTMLESAAEDLAVEDPPAAIMLLADAEEATLYTGDVGAAIRVGSLAGRVGQRCPEGVEKSTASTLDGIGHLYAGHFERAAALLRPALADATASTDLNQILLSARVASATGEDVLAWEFGTRALRMARERGALGALPLILERVSFYEITLGRYGTAHEHGVEGLGVARETGQEPGVILSGLARVCALRGQEDQCRTYAAEAMERARQRGSGLIGSLATWAAGLLDLTLGRPDQAARVLKTALHPDHELAHGVIALLMTPDFIEAAARTGDRVAAEAMLATFQPWAQMVGQPWALGRVRHCMGVLTDGDEAEDNFAAALELTPDTTRPFERARTELLFGEHLRRNRQRVASRDHLRTALIAFETIGANGWAERARVELRASGETTRRREPTSLEQLTPQQLQVARFVAKGMSNKEVAAQMFLSPRTVDAHLRNVFTKLGVTSRARLAQMSLRMDDAEAEPSASASGSPSS